MAGADTLILVRDVDSLRRRIAELEAASNGLPSGRSS